MTLAQLLGIASQGIGAESLALFVNRATLGVFFALSGFHKLTNAQRHATFVETLRACHVPCIAFNEWFVPCVEFGAGFAVALGILAPLFALGLVAICVVAACTDGARRVIAFAPIDAADRLDDWLYLPEILYVVQALILITCGPGALAIL